MRIRLQVSTSIFKIDFIPTSLKDPRNKLWETSTFEGQQNYYRLASKADFLYKLDYWASKLSLIK